MSTLVFEDLSALRAALDAGLVPATIQAAPVAFAYDDDGKLLLEPSEDVARGDRKRLRDAGIELRRRKVRDGLALSCWAEAIPVLPGPEPAPPLGEILFLSEGEEGFLQVAGELLRLGSEDQRLAFYEDEEGVRRNLCRVAEPPYYAVLRALDRNHPLRAFAPARPGGRVWVELGFDHPQATRLEAPPGQLLLIPRPPHASRDLDPWLRVPDGPWLDLHAVSDVTLPPSTTWEPCDPPRRLQIELRLVRAPVNRPPSLWVLRERAVEQIEQLVRTIPDEIVARLRFATIEGPQGTMVVLRARRSAEGPPALDLAAEAYVPTSQIPDLHLPVGMTVDPPLRPSKLRELLLTGGDRVLWLAAQDSGDRSRPFVRESLAESAFAPLDEWVDYLVGAHVDDLKPWLRSAAFDFDPYLSIGVEWADGEGPRPRSERKVREERPRQQARSAIFESPEELPEEAGEEEVAPPPVAAPVLAPIDLPRSAVEERLAALERAFCELDTPLDDPGRVPRWAELGNLQAALLRWREAGLCWSRALWEQGPATGPTPLALARRWVQSEAGALGYPEGMQMLGIVDVLENDLDEQMVRGLAAAVVSMALARQAGEASVQSGEASGEIDADRLAALQRFFAAHGALLDLRTLWLARSALARLAGDDRLALFQTRDFIMAALREGVGLARNIPAFVRTHGNTGSDADAGNLGRLADELLRVRDEYLSTKRTRSAIEATFSEELTRAYVRLIFAWGLARLGRSQTARDELEAARNLLGGRLADAGGDALHRAAFSAFEARVGQSLDGLPPGAPLSAEAGGPIAARELLQGLDRYKYNHLVGASRILNPRHDVDAFDLWGQKDEEPFAGLALLTKPDKLAALFDRMLGEFEGLGPDRRAESLQLILEFLEALPEPLAVPRLQTVLSLLPRVELEARPPLLRNALLLAGYYDRGDLVTAVLAAIETDEQALTGERPAAYAELLARSSPVLRRSGLEARLGALLSRLEEQLGSEQGLEMAIARLHIAGAFASLGQPERVQGAFAGAHALLPEVTGIPNQVQRLLREIAITLSRSTPGQAIAGARALLERLPETSDSMSTNSHFCLAVIQLMEAVVLSLASEDLALSDWARHWVEEDEHLLHRRIHRELATAT
ncbi:MAG: hypothetical protein KC457_03660 [Myxococcales bacterium]|nr:hypothetical protein [Myxococcales bacterium]